MFEIIKNTLELPEVNYRCIKLENDYYVITFAYTSDYIQDKQNNNLKNSEITTICKPKKSAPLYTPIFNWYHTRFLFEIPNVSIYSEKDMKELQNAIDIALNAKSEIEEIFFQFFPKDAIK